MCAQQIWAAPEVRFRACRTMLLRSPWLCLRRALKSCLLSQVRHLINAINEASAAIPGWDAYSATGHAQELWDGVLPSS